MLNVKLLTIVVSMSVIVTLMTLRDSSAQSGNPQICGPLSNWDPRGFTPSILKGPFAYEITCGPNEFITSITAYGSSYVDGVEVTCRKIGRVPNILSQDEGNDATGELGNPDHITATATCSPGRAVTRMVAHCGLYVDSIRTVQCSPYNLTTNAFGRPGNAQTLNVGGAGGRRKILRCPEGEALYRITGKNDHWIDSMFIHCKKPTRVERRRQGAGQFRPPTARDLEQFKQR